MSDILKASLQDNQCIVTDSSAISLYNRGYYGISTSEGLLLSSFESLHLLELERITVFSETKSQTPEDLIQFFKENDINFLTRYLVYKDLRNRGYIVNQGKGSSFFFRLYERGAVPTKDSAKFYVTPLQEGKSINLSELNDLISISAKSKKQLVFGMVDSSGDVSYQKVDRLIPDAIHPQKTFVEFESWSWEGAWKKSLEQ